jgi:hypothetical protein
MFLVGMYVWVMGWRTKEVKHDVKTCEAVASFMLQTSWFYFKASILCTYFEIYKGFQFAWNSIWGLVF